MGIELFNGPPMAPYEEARGQAVLASGALRMSGNAELQSIAQEARRVFETAMSAVSIVHEDWQYLIAASGLPTGPYSRRASLCGYTILEPSHLMYVLDANYDPRFCANPRKIEQQSIRFYVGAALICRDMLPIGSLCVFDPKPRDVVTADQTAQLRRLAGKVVELIKSSAPTSGR